MDNPMLLQKQIKDNTEDLHNFVRDLKLWEEEMKRKDRQLSNDQSEDILPPIRRPKLEKNAPVKKEVKEESKKKRIQSYDYKSWDKFDVDKACEEVDNEDVKSEDENEVEKAVQEENYLKEKALYEKELGNRHVKAGKWDEAIECYTKSITAYPRDPVFFANRALCYLKKKKYEAVEEDCTKALKLDSTYVKALLRRAAARECLDRLEDAKHDLRSALQLEPNNPQAQRDLSRLQAMGNKSNNPKKKVPEKEISPKISNTQEQPSQTNSLKLPDKTNIEIKKENTGESSRCQSSISEPNWEPCENTIDPIFKPPHLRSKKSLKHIKIHDIDKNMPEHVCARRLPKFEELQQVVLKPSSTVPETSQVSGSNSEPQQVELKPSSTVPETSQVSVSKPRSILTTAAPPRNVPPVPKTSVQFHTYWSSIKADQELCFQFLKQIPGADLPNIFKESLESRMFSDIILILATLFIEAGVSVVSYLQGLSQVRRFSTIALFMSQKDKSNVTKMLEYSLDRKDCSLEETNELKRLYEIS